MRGLETKSKPRLCRPYGLAYQPRVRPVGFYVAWVRARTLERPPMSLAADKLPTSSCFPQNSLSSDLGSCTRLSWPEGSILLAQSLPQHHDSILGQVMYTRASMVNLHGDHRETYRNCEKVKVNHGHRASDNVFRPRCAVSIQDPGDDLGALGLVPSPTWPRLSLRTKL
jgi:hypothetical protein